MADFTSTQTSDCTFSWTPTTTGCLERYAGCLAGALLGDCIGCIFEFRIPAEAIRILAAIERYKKDNGQMHYTDDTAMLQSIAYSLTECHGFDAKHMAKMFADRYRSDIKAGKGRGYGYHVKFIFHQWTETKCEGDVFKPSQLQFDGKGSYGNGAAMRTACVPLFYYSDINRMVQKAKTIGQLTHSNTEGYNGAILISLAVYLALSLNNSQKFDSLFFIDKLMELYDDHTTEDPDSVYKIRLQVARRFLERDNVSRVEVVELLGNEVRAAESVTTAIYCALVGNKDLDGIMTTNPVEKTILYAISLGGDTDTIATMAGAISGAYYGIDVVPKDWLRVCEGYAETGQIAEMLFKNRK